MEIQIIKELKQYENELHNVKINHEKIANFVSSVSTKDFERNRLKFSHYDWSLANLQMIVIYFNSMNFCFWAEKGQPKWTIKVEGVNLDGSVALFRALEEEAKKNPTFLRPSTAAHMEFNEFKELLKGNVDIPLIKERYQNLVNVAQVLSEKYDSSVENLIKSGDSNAELILENIVKDFTSFSDSQNYKNNDLNFLKRAQLQVKMIDDQLKYYKKNGLSNMKSLTAFADYKIPQLLRHIGVLEYSDNLAFKVDSQTLIAKDSVEEVEIRIATILAIDFIYQSLKQESIDIVSSDIDTLLWLRTQNNSSDIKPYHRTYTTAY